MTKPRKTIELAKLVDRANIMLAAPKGDAEVRVGVFLLLESMLHEANAYRGFSYLDGHEAVAASNYDETRRRYSGGSK